MMISVATILFTAMMATALLSLAWDLTRQLADPDANHATLLARAEARRIAALPRVRQPLRVITGLDSVAVVPAGLGSARQSVSVRRPMQPAFAAAA